MRGPFRQKHASILLDPTVSTPLYKQLYEGVRSAILRGQLQAGARLPSTRALALELGISRATVQLSFEQLIAEGYLQGRAGSGTYVAATFPPEGVEQPAQDAHPGQSSSTGRTISAQVLLLEMVDNSISPLRTHFGLVFSSLVCPVRVPHP